MIIFNNSYRNLIIEYCIAIKGFQFQFSLLHAISVFSFIVFLILLQDYISCSACRKTIVVRTYNTFVYENSIIIKGLISFLTLITVLLFIHLVQSFFLTPELILVYTLYLISLYKPHNKKKIKNNAKDLNKKTKNQSFFSESAIDEYSKLDEYQKQTIHYLKTIIERTNDDYFSVAINGKWGTGKSSITNGFVNRNQEYEFIEINLWGTPSYEESINELKDKISDFIKFAFLPIEKKELAYFNSFISTINKDVGGISKIFSGYIPTSESKTMLEKKIEKTLIEVGKSKLIVIFDDIDRIPASNLNAYLKQIAFISGLKNVISITNIDINAIENKIISSENLGNNTILSESINFLDKIFSVRINSPQNQNYIRIFFNNCLEDWSINIQEIDFTDKNYVIEDIRTYINTNPNLFESYREVKQVLNDLGIYYVAFNRKKIRIREYIPTEVVIILTLIKYQYPEFYRKLMNYINGYLDEFSPVISNYEKVERKAYNIKNFVDNNLLSDIEKKEELADNNVFSVKTKYLEDGIRLQKLYHLIGQAIDKGLKNRIIAEKFVTNRVHEYEVTYEDIESIKSRKLSIEEITNILYANDALKNDYHPVYLSKRTASFIEEIKKERLYNGNRLKALVAIFNVYHFGEYSLRSQILLEKMPVEIAEIFEYSHEIKDELNEISVENFDYEMFFNLWENVITVPGGRELFSIIRKRDGTPNLLAILMSPRYINYFIEIGSIYFIQRAKVEDERIFIKEKNVIKKIKEHKFQHKSFLTHLLLLCFYQHHPFFAQIEEHKDSNPRKLFEKFQMSEYDGKILSMMSDLLFEDLNEPGLYLMIEKYEYIGGFHPFRLMSDLIYLNILAKNDDIIFKNGLRKFKDLYQKVGKTFPAKDTLFIIRMLLNAVFERINNNSFNHKQINLINAEFPSLMSINSIEIFMEKLEKLLNHKKKIHNAK